jgi:hypothetical protein
LGNSCCCCPRPSPPASWPGLPWPPLWSKRFSNIPPSAPVARDRPPRPDIRPSWGPLVGNLRLAPPPGLFVPGQSLEGCKLPAHTHGSIATVVCSRGRPSCAPVCFFALTCPARQRRGFSFRGVSQAGNQIVAVIVVDCSSGPPETVRNAASLTDELKVARPAERARSSAFLDCWNGDHALIWRRRHLRESISSLALKRLHRQGRARCDRAGYWGPTSVGLFIGRDIPRRLP